MATNTVITCDICGHEIEGGGSLQFNVLVQTILNGQLKVLNLCVAQPGFENGCGDRVMHDISVMDHNGPTAVAPAPEPAPEPAPAQ